MIKKTVLVTGATGFVGRVFCEYITSLGLKLKVFATDINPDQYLCCDKFFVADLSNFQATSDLVKNTKPDYIIHLAGAFATENIEKLYQANLISTASLLDAVCEFAPDAIVVTAGSAAEYGRVSPDQLPVNEENPCLPVTPYGLTKFLATQLSLYYHRYCDLNVMIVRPFQLIGKGITTKLVPGAFAEQLIATARTGEKVINVGNLQSSRDFLNVKDAIRAIWMLCNDPAPGQIFNLCSTKAVKIDDLLQMMIKCAQLDITINIDSNRLRGNQDVSHVYGDFQKIEKHCGWTPDISLKQSVAELLDEIPSA